MTDGHFHRHLVDAFETLEREVPAHYRATVEALGAHRVHVSIDGEEVLVMQSSARLRALGGAPRHDISVSAATAHAALVELLNGEVELIDLLLDERLLLRGSVPDLLALERALHHFLQGAVRAPSFPRILRSFRRSTRPS